MNVETYLERLGCLHLKDAKPSLETLKELQFNHLKTFPFETFDLHGKFKRHIPLSVEDAYKKMVIERRGGYCLELNGCFGWLLEQLGYDLYFVEVHTFYVNLKKFSTALTHTILFVTLENKKYYVDVGTSRFIRTPVEFKFDGMQKDYLGTYRFIRDSSDPSYIIFLRAPNATVYDENTEWFEQMKFRDIPRKFSDLHEMNENVQTIMHPMVFCRTFCSKQFDTYSLALYGNTLTEFHFDENKKETRVDHKDLTNDEVKKIIRERFQLQIDDSFQYVDEPYDDV